MLTQAVDVVGNPGGEGSLDGGGPVVHNGGVLELVLLVLGSEHDHALLLPELGHRLLRAGVGEGVVLLSLAAVLANVCWMVESAQQPPDQR